MGEKYSIRSNTLHYCGGYRSPNSGLVSTAILAKTACTCASGHGPPSFGPIELRASDCSQPAASAKPPVLVNSNWPPFGRFQNPEKIQMHCQAPPRQPLHPANVPKLTPTGQYGTGQLQKDQGVSDISKSRTAWEHGATAVHHPSDDPAGTQLDRGSLSSC